MNRLMIILLFLQPAGLVTWEKPVFYGVENVYIGDDWILAGSSVMPYSKVYLLDGKTGEELWEFRTKHPLTDLYASEDKVVVTTEKGIHVLDLSTGEPLWETLTLLPGTKHAFPVTGSVVINDKLIALHSRVEAYNLSTGESLWNWSFTECFLADYEPPPGLREQDYLGRPGSLALVPFQQGVAAACGSEVLLLDAQGEDAGSFLALWELSTVYASGQKLYLLKRVQKKGSFLSYSVINGSAIWTYEPGGELGELYVSKSGIGEVSISGNSLALSEGSIVSLIDMSGKGEWSFAAEDPFIDTGFVTTVLLQDDMVLAGTRHGFIFALDADTGELLWKHRIGWQKWVKEIQVRDSIAAVASSGGLYILDLERSPGLGYTPIALAALIASYVLAGVFAFKRRRREPLRELAPRMLSYGFILLGLLAVLMFLAIQGLKLESFYIFGLLFLGLGMLLGAGMRSRLRLVEAVAAGAALQSVFLFPIAALRIHEAIALLGVIAGVLAGMSRPSTGREVPLALLAYLGGKIFFTSLLMRPFESYAPWFYARRLAIDAVSWNDFMGTIIGLLAVVAGGVYAWQKHRETPSQ